MRAEATAAWMRTITAPYFYDAAGLQRNSTSGDGSCKAPVVGLEGTKQPLREFGHASEPRERKAILRGSFGVLRTL